MDQVKLEQLLNVSQSNPGGAQQQLLEIQKNDASLLAVPQWLVSSNAHLQFFAAQTLFYQVRECWRLIPSEVKQKLHDYLVHFLSDAALINAVGRIALKKLLQSVAIFAINAYPEFWPAPLYDLLQACQRALQGERWETISALLVVLAEIPAELERLSSLTSTQYTFKHAAGELGDTISSMLFVIATSCANPSQELLQAWLACLTQWTIFKSFRSSSIQQLIPLLFDLLLSSNPIIPLQDLLQTILHWMESGVEDLPLAGLHGRIANLQGVFELASSSDDDEQSIVLIGQICHLFGELEGDALVCALASVHYKELPLLRLMLLLTRWECQRCIENGGEADVTLFWVTFHDALSKSSSIERSSEHIISLLRELFQMLTTELNISMATTRTKLVNLLHYRKGLRGVFCMIYEGAREMIISFLMTCTMMNRDRMEFALYILDVLGDNLRSQEQVIVPVLQSAWVFVEDLVLGHSLILAISHHADLVCKDQAMCTTVVNFLTNCIRRDRNATVALNLLLKLSRSHPSVAPSHPLIISSLSETPIDFNAKISLDIVEITANCLASLSLLDQKAIMGVLLSRCANVFHTNQAHGLDLIARLLSSLPPNQPLSEFPELIELIRQLFGSNIQPAENPLLPKYLGVLQSLAYLLGPDGFQQMRSLVEPLLGLVMDCPMLELGDFIESLIPVYGATISQIILSRYLPFLPEAIRRSDEACRPVSIISKAIAKTPSPFENYAEWWKMVIEALNNRLSEREIDTDYLRSCIKVMMIFMDQAEVGQISSQIPSKHLLSSLGQSLIMACQKSLTDDQVEVVAPALIQIIQIGSIDFLPIARHLLLSNSPPMTIAEEQFKKLMGCRAPRRFALQLLAIIKNR